MADRADALALFGTVEPQPERRRLVAGPLSAVLEDGNLRDIRFQDVEVVRAINYLARDESWGTFKPEISSLRILQDEKSFAVAYDGRCGEPGRGFSYKMRIHGEASGLLTMEADGVALSDFLTNRTGFVILHPAEVAGGRMDIVHVDGRREAATFPRRISADQPAFDIAAISHDAAPGLSCTIEMEGDAFEMEDQRNWADASFKTYVRPLSKPRPYIIAKDGRDRQRIAMRVTGRSMAGATGLADAAFAMRETPGYMPAIALFIDELEVGNLLPRDVSQHLVVRFDPERPGAEAELSRITTFANNKDTSVAVELVLSAHDPDSEAVEALRRLHSCGVVPSTLLVSPRREFKSRPSRVLPNGEAATDDIVGALRTAGFIGRIGVGTPSYFAEFNRNPPGTSGDFIFFSVAATVHAADDISVAETISVYPVLVESANALRPGRPVWLGPCTIGVRHNPYGAATQPNPSNCRVASATVDPRQTALFGAAYAAAAAIQAASCGVETVTLGAPTGPFGIVNVDGSRRPIHTVVAELAKAAGSRCHSLRSGISGVYGIFWESGEGMRGLVVNLSHERISFNLPEDLEKSSVLLSDASWSQPVTNSRLDLPSYRTALLLN